MTARKPSKLAIGDTMGIVSPSSAIPSENPSRLKKGINGLSKLGYKVKLGRFVTNKLGYMAGSVQERVQDIHDMFEDPAVDAIICTIGGYSSNQLIEHLDYNLIRKNPKIFMGFSDVTNLLLAINSKTDLITFHGPMVMTQFGETPQILPFTLRNMEKVICQTSNLTILEASSEWTDEYLDWKKELDIRPRNMVKTKGWNVLKEGNVQALLIGGNLRSLQGLLGTEFLRSLDGSILFWEETQTNIPSIDRTLTYLHLSGALKNLKGMIVGRLGNEIEFPEPDYTLEKCISRVTQQYDFPVILNVDIGHTDPILTMPLGVNARVDTAKCKIALEEPAVL